MRWDRLSILMDQLISPLEEMQYFRMNRAREALSEQCGVVRTNCMDCLDRSNVVQSIIARHILEKQLEQFNIIPKGSHIKDYDSFESVFRNVWADNADMMAAQYTGTGALKTDFTRSGFASFNSHCCCSCHYTWYSIPILVYLSKSLCLESASAQNPILCLVI